MAVLMHPWGRFSVRGSEAVERRIAGIVTAVADAVRAELEPASYRALILAGGYGRGEGGVEVVAGEERPHNNLDFLLIATRFTPGLQGRLDALLQPIREQHGLGIDLSVTTVRRLRHSPPLVLWYDMRFGHKTVLGDAELVPALEQFSRERILPSDVRNLLVNRGTLLLINDLLLQQRADWPETRRTVVRHAMKSIIGYGDALLFFRGAYHWSYQEKQRRMREQAGVPARLRELYEAAMEFRFQPDYALYRERDLAGWMAELRELFGPVHLACERLRLRRPQLDWNSYGETAFVEVLREEPLSVRSWLRKVRNLVRAAPCPAAGNWAARLGCCCGGWRNLLAVVFPVVAYRLEEGALPPLARAVLTDGRGGFDALRDGYLHRWGEHCDPNFQHVLRAGGLALAG